MWRVMGVCLLMLSVVSCRGAFFTKEGYANKSYCSAMREYIFDTRLAGGGAFQATSRSQHINYMQAYRSRCVDQQEKKS